MTNKKSFQKGFRQKFTKVKTAKGRKMSSTKWLQRQLNDPFTLMAKKEHYRSRSAYKLLEIEQKYQVISKAHNILDLGCAPGGWLQICQKINNKAKITGVDILPIEEIAQVNFIQGDFLSDDIKEKLENICLNDQNNNATQINYFDLILCDIAPPTCGHSNTDHLRIMHIVENINLFNQKYLKKGGNFISKVFLGAEIDALLLTLKKQYKTVKLFKPEATRKESKEQYIVCLDFN